MWDERERWLQRVRICVFVLAVSTLVTAWWRYDSDPRAMPMIFSPIDAWLHDTTQPKPQPISPRASVPETGAGRSGTATGGASVGTTGRGSTGNGNDRVGPSANGNAAIVTVEPPRSVGSLEREARATRTPAKQAPSQLDPCDPRQKTTPNSTTQKSTDTPPSPRAGGALPCDEAQSGKRTTNTPPMPASRVDDATAAPER